MAHGTDPGQVSAGGGVKEKDPGQLVDSTDDVDESELTADIEQVAYDQITSRIAEDFDGHNLATLITGLLEAEGLNCTQSPPGPDGGIDIVAGRGLLGLDDPILVQVKSGAPVGSPVVDQLHGVMNKHGPGRDSSWPGVACRSRPRRN